LRAREYAQGHVPPVDTNESEQRKGRGVQYRFDQFGKRRTESQAIDALHRVAVRSVDSVDGDQHGRWPDNIGDALRRQRLRRRPRV
jgi:hypothetical protein